MQRHLRFKSVFRPMIVINVSAEKSFLRHQQYQCSTSGPLKLPSSGGSFFKWNAPESFNSGSRPLRRGSLWLSARRRLSCRGLQYEKMSVVSIDNFSIANDFSPCSDPAYSAELATAAQVSFTGEFKNAQLSWASVVSRPTSYR